MNDNGMNDKSQKRKEEISALMDNEASELELRRLLRSMDDDDTLSETWSRYHLASNALKGEVDGEIHFDISAQVSAAIADEETYSMHHEERVIEVSSQSDPLDLKASDGAKSAVLGKYFQPLVQAAIAASVAVLVVGGWQFNQGSNSFSADLEPSPRFSQANITPVRGQAQLVNYGAASGVRSANSIETVVSPANSYLTSGFPQFASSEKGASNGVQHANATVREGSKNQLVEGYFVRPMGSAAMSAGTATISFARDVVDGSTARSK